MDDKRWFDLCSEELKSWVDFESEESNRRISICKECPSYDTVWSKCTECHCFMPLKTLFIGLDCPLGKWGTVTNTSVETEE